MEEARSSETDVGAGWAGSSWRLGEDAGSPSFGSSHVTWERYLSSRGCNIYDIKVIKLVIWVCYESKLI